jgi:membrane protein
MDRARRVWSAIEARYLRWRWARIVHRAFARARGERVPDMGATLAYFTILSVFPFVIVLLGLLGLIGAEPETSNAVLDIFKDLGPDSAAETYKGPVESLIAQDANAGTALGIGVVFALYTASSYVGAFMRAANRIFGVAEDRPFWKLRPLQIWITIATVLLLGVTLIALAVSGPIAAAIGDELGIPKATVTLYSVAKWPAVVVVLVAVVGLLYGTSPNVRQVRRRFVSPGCLWSVGIWVLGSAGFTVYISNFSHYDKTYGSLAGLIIFVVWIWLSNLALLVGLLLDAEIQHERENEGGSRPRTPGVGTTRVSDPGSS